MKTIIMIRHLFILLNVITASALVLRTSAPSFTTTTNVVQPILTRNSFISQTVNTIILISGSTSVSANDDDQQARTVVTNKQIQETVTSDIINGQFLVTGKITKSIYDPKATFTDEIDTYQMDQWITGTQKLFVGDKSAIRLIGNVNVSKEKAEFRFDEDLMFNIPFRPVVKLTGKVILERDMNTGLIISYREYWDQDILTVLKSAKF